MHARVKKFNLWLLVSLRVEQDAAMKVDGTRQKTEVKSYADIAQSYCGYREYS